jgi:predicted TIM-barrel fold metal-dependent hydrolase
MPRSYQIIDADAHVNPLPDFWQEYLPLQYRDAAPRFESGDDVDYVVFEGKRMPFLLMNAQAGRKAENYRLYGRKAETRPGGWEPAARCADMDTDGVDAAVLYGGGPLASRDIDQHLASFDAYNRWLADFCRAAPERLFGIGYIPMLEVDDAMARIRAIAASGLKGVLIPAFPQSKRAVETMANSGARGAGAGGAAFALTGDPFGARRYCDAEFDPFWAAAVELGMPVHMHLGARPTRPDPQLFLPDMLMSKLTMAEPIAIMVFGGVFMRHPQLKLVSVESGVGWFGFAASYMDKLWHKHRHWTGNTLVEPPSAYMDRQVYGTFLEETAGLLLRNQPGGRNIMWSSDYPHSETSWPESREVISRTLGALPPHERYRIVCGLAKELYHA